MGYMEKCLWQLKAKEVVLKMTIKSVVGIVKNKDKILLGKKVGNSKKFLKGKWHIPGGKTKKGELPKEALKREIKEETGLEIYNINCILKSKTPTSKREMLWFICFCNESKLNPNDDLEKAEWFNKKEVLEKCTNEVTCRWPKEILYYFKD